MNVISEYVIRDTTIDGLVEIAKTLPYNFYDVSITEKHFANPFRKSTNAIDDYIKHFTNDVKANRVMFNEKKGATTLLKGDKVTVVKTCKGDKFDKKYGFLLAYFQQNCGLSKTQANKYLKELVEDNE